MGIQIYLGLRSLKTLPKIIYLKSIILKLEKRLLEDQTQTLIFCVSFVQVSLFPLSVLFSNLLFSQYDPQSPQYPYTGNPPKPTGALVFGHKRHNEGNPCTRLRWPPRFPAPISGAGTVIARASKPVAGTCSIKAAKRSGLHLDKRPAEPRWSPDRELLGCPVGS